MSPRNRNTKDNDGKTPNEDGSMQSAETMTPDVLETFQLAPTAPPPVRPAGSGEVSAPPEGAGVTFGHYLTRAREAKGLSLDDLAHQTKIRRIILDQLEHNARRELPEKVFVLGYVRSYAAAVGLNVEEALQRCANAWDDDAALLAGAAAEGTKRSFAWIWPVLALMGAGGAIWFIVRLQ